MERSLGLPARTLARWKNENIVPSAAALALMRFIRTFPWLLRVAEKEFDQEKAHEVFLSEGKAEIRENNYQDVLD